MPIDDLFEFFIGVSPFKRNAVDQVAGRAAKFELLRLGHVGLNAIFHFVGIHVFFDFADVETMVKDWIDREFDHRLLLKRGDPLIGPLKELGEPVVVFEMNPSAEGIARTIYQYLADKGMPVKEVKVWETETAWASYCGEE